jgi:uncharacterized membrane protein YjdF
MSSEPQTERRILPIALVAAYVSVFILLGIAPYDRGTWWAENIPIVALAGALVVLYVRGVRLSNLAYLLGEQTHQVLRYTSKRAGVLRCTQALFTAWQRSHLARGEKAGGVNP